MISNHHNIDYYDHHPSHPHSPPPPPLSSASDRSPLLQRRHNWSSILSPSPNKPRFPMLSQLPSIIRQRQSPIHPLYPIQTHLSQDLSSASYHPSTPGEDLNNFIWDATDQSQHPSSSPIIPTLYHVSLPVKRTRPAPPHPILTQPSMNSIHSSNSPGNLTPTHPASAGSLKTSIHKLLRKRTVRHLKNNSNSSSGSSASSSSASSPLDIDSDTPVDPIPYDWDRFGNYDRHPIFNPSSDSSYPLTYDE